MLQFCYPLAGKRHCYALLAAICMVVFAFPVESHANSTGRTGRTQVNAAGCGSCHGSSSSSATSLEITSASGSFTVNPGSTTTFTLEVSHSVRPKAGCNIAVKTTESGNTDAGNLQPATGSGLQKSGSELTHTSPKSLSGGSVEFEFTWEAPQTPGSYWLRAIANCVNDNSSADVNDDWNWLDPIELTVEEVPEVTVNAPNGGEGWCPGSSHDISWDAAAVDFVKIELSSDGGQSFPTTLAASVDAEDGSWQWDIPLSQQVGDMYRVRISDAADAAVRDESNTNFSIAGPPEITQQPEAQEKCEGQAVTFSVAAQGPGLQYQWRKDGQDLSGKTDASLLIGSAAAADAGDYDVVVTGACGDEVSSETAALVVKARPTITSQPQSLAICEGETAMFSVEAEGDDLSYQWRKDGQDINGATEAQLIIQPAASADAGTYTVLVSGFCTPAVSSEAVGLIVGSQQEIVSHSEDTDVCEGEELTLTVDAEGSELEYRWRLEGQDIPGAITATLQIGQVGLDDAGTYDVIVLSACGDPVASGPIRVDVIELPRISADPMAQTVTEGESVEFSVTATGDNLQYQWQRNAEDIAGATESMLSIDEAEFDDQGAYTCVVSNECGEVTSAAAALTVLEQGPGPVIGLSTTTQDFGSILLGAEERRTVDIRNTGDEDLVISAVNFSAAGWRTELSLPATVNPEQSLGMELIFSPDAAGTFTADVTLESNARNGAVSAELNGVILLARTENGSLAFGSVREAMTGSLPISVEVGSQTARITAADFSGATPAAFALDADLPLDLAAGEISEVIVNFTPPAVGDYSAELSLSIEGQEQAILIQVSGTGTMASSVDGGGMELAATLAVYPNPLRDKELRMSIALPQPGEFDLRVIDMRGSTVFHVRDYHNGAGPHSLTWSEAGGRASGIYRVVLRSGNQLLSMPLLILQ